MKGNLLQGTVCGRMGEIVAKVIHGEQVLSKYHPTLQILIVKNNKCKENSKHISSYESVRNDLFLLNIKPTYNHYSGASKRFPKCYISI